MKLAEHSSIIDWKVHELAWNLHKIKFALVWSHLTKGVHLGKIQRWIALLDSRVFVPRKLWALESILVLKAHLHSLHKEGPKGGPHNIYNTWHTYANKKATHPDVCSVFGRIWVHYHHNVTQLLGCILWDHVLGEHSYHLIL